MNGKTTDHILNINYSATDPRRGERTEVGGRWSECREGKHRAWGGEQGKDRGRKSAVGGQSAKSRERKEQGVRKDQKIRKSKVGGQRSMHTHVEEA